MFTPGPWIDNGNEIVAVSNPKVGIGGFLKDEDNILGAAAPDMYEALKNAIHNIKIGGTWSLRAAEEAIAKAEGRKPE